MEAVRGHHIFIPLRFHCLEEQKGVILKTTRSRKRPKDETILVSLAESIGSTLGSIAAKADATQKAFTKPHATSSVTRKTRAAASSAKKMVRGLKQKAKLRRGGRRASTARASRRPRK
jgi:hypothetical protein